MGRAGLTGDPTSLAHDNIFSTFSITGRTFFKRHPPGPPKELPKGKRNDALKYYHKPMILTYDYNLSWVNVDPMPKIEILGHIIQPQELGQTYLQTDATKLNIY